MSGPLNGLRVIALAGLGPLPFASMVLADLGADVVRVSRPLNRQRRQLQLTEGLAAEHDLVNRGVRSCELDLKSPEGIGHILTLAAHADIVLEGFRPGVTERLGIGPDVLLATNPALVYGRLTGYGQSGPLATTAGHDINYVAQSGLLHALGDSRDHQPPRPPLNLLGDYAGGGLLAALGVLAAVYQARTSHVGQVVDVSMVDGVALLTAKVQGLRAAGQLSDEPAPNFLDGTAPFYATYRCADGRDLAVGALESDFYEQFITGLAVDTTDWPEQNDRANWPRLRRLIADTIATQPLEHWKKTYAGTDACVTPVMTFDEAAADPHNRSRGLYRTIDGATHPAPAPRFSRTPTPEPTAPLAGASDTVQAVLTRWASPTSH